MMRRNVSRERAGGHTGGPRGKESACGESGYGPDLTGKRVPGKSPIPVGTRRTTVPTIANIFGAGSDSV